MKIKCMDDNCEKIETYPSRASAVKDGWRWDEFEIDGGLYRYGYCKDHKEENRIPNFEEDYDYHSGEDVEEMKERLMKVENAGRPQGRKPGTIDASGGKSQTLDQF